MKGNRSLVTLALALVAVALVVFSLPGGEAFAAVVLPAKVAAHAFDWHSLTLDASVALVAMRRELDELTGQAARKLEDVKAAGLTADQVRAIESEHAALLSKIEGKRSEIAAAERDATDQAGAALIAERARSAELITLGARHNLEQTVVSQHIAAGTSVDAFRAVVLDALAARSASNTVRPGGASVGIINPGESPADVRSAMVDGLIMRSLGYAPDGTRGTPKVADAARSREFAGMGLLELGAELAGIRNAHRMPRVVLFDQLVERSMLGTTDYPLLLAAAANKFLLAQYGYQDPSYRRFSAKKNFNDFKAHQFLRVGDFPTLEALSETGEFKNGALSENKEAVSAATYGKIVGLSRQMFVNDDLSAFADLTGAAGRRVADFENSVAWAVILSNSGAGPTLSDGGNVFNSTVVTTAGGHANLAGTPSAVTTAALDLARKSLRTKKSLDGIPLNLNPTIIVAGPNKQTEIEQMLSTNLLATQLSNINVFNGQGLTKLDPVIDAYITDNAWYTFADPAVAPVFIWGYVSGYEGPRFAIDQPFRQDGLSFKVAEDFGFGAIDWRPAYRNAGA